MSRVATARKRTLSTVSVLVGPAISCPWQWVTASAAAPEYGGAAAASSEPLPGVGSVRDHPAQGGLGEHLDGDDLVVGVRHRNEALLEVGEADRRDLVDRRE